MRLSRLLALGALLCMSVHPAARAGVAPFDLAGPDLEVTVTRGHETLPIAAVPNLAVGDHLWIRADLPPTQSEHYLLIVAFLRGATNPPPESWFHSCATWDRRCARRGMMLRVPRGAGQVLVFLAPETNGDLRTLIGAVRGRPGAFVRTSQDLNQATLDISRLDRYLRVVQRLGEHAPESLPGAAPKLARSLAIKVNAKCLQRIPQLQAPCLMRGGQSLILNDGHSTSIVEALTSGPAAALAMEASYTPQLSYGYYSPYIASVLDIAHIFSSFTTAHYQYIPALAAQSGDVLSLTLNTPPSFHDPKSVLVTALPAIEASQLPPLHAVHLKEHLCVRRRTLVLPVEGAPLVFSTDYAHSMTLRLTGSNGRTITLPTRANAQLGGFVVDTRPMARMHFGKSVVGVLHGYWGFSPYLGPRFQLENARTSGWSLTPPDEDAVIVGRQDTINLTAPGVSCIQNIELRDAAGRVIKTQWKPTHPNEVQVQLPLQHAQPGPLTVIVRQFGRRARVSVPLEAYSEPASLDRFVLHAGDSQGLLKGSRLDEVAGLTIDGVAFLPGALSTQQGVDQLTVTAANPQAAAKLKQGEAGLASVRLKDGRVLMLRSVIAAPRPSVTLIAMSVYPSPSGTPSHIELASGNELPQQAQLTFSVRAKWPAAFGHNESLEVATADGSYSTTLSLTNGGITLENQRVAIATLDPARAFGPSAFGPLQFRVIDHGVAGGWQPLATLVRLPRLSKLVCPATPKLACKLSGSDLFLLDEIASDPALRHAVQVPDGFPGYALPVPHPRGGMLYVKLRDDPSVINLATLAVRQLPSPHKAASHASARQVAAAKRTVKARKRPTSVQAATAAVRPATSTVARTPRRAASAASAKPAPTVLAPPQTVAAGKAPAAMKPQASTGKANTSVKAPGSASASGASSARTPSGSASTHKHAPSPPASATSPTAAAPQSS
ncbi:MAG: hypothetical protein ACP5PN_06480 [Steroidobacteraceae bacterium]